MVGCTQGNSRLSVIIIVTSGRPCNQGEPWKEHWHLWLSQEKGYVGTGGCCGGHDSNEQGARGLHRTVCLVADCDLANGGTFPSSAS